MLINRTNYLTGLTLDLGAGTQKYRHIIEKCCDKYISLDAFSKSDVRGNAMVLPFPNAVFDTVICTQVIEHVPRPWLVIHEVYRVLKKNGYLLLSAPFLYPYHLEPCDYFRYTRDGLRALLEDAHLTTIEIKSMGGGTVVFIEYFNKIMGNGRLQRALIKRLQSLATRLEPESAEYLNTPNYFVIAQK
jgi:SAM-dependent methyltransferase